VFATEKDWGESHPPTMERRVRGYALKQGRVLDHCKVDLEDIETHEEGRVSSWLSQKAMHRTRTSAHSLTPDDRGYHEMHHENDEQLSFDVKIGHKSEHSTWRQESLRTFKGSRLLCTTTSHHRRS